MPSLIFLQKDFSFSEHESIKTQGETEGNETESDHDCSMRSKDVSFGAVGENTNSFGILNEDVLLSDENDK